MTASWSAGFAEAALSNSSCRSPNEVGVTNRVSTRVPIAPRPGPAGRVILSLLSGFELRLDGRPLPVPLSSQRVVAFLGEQGMIGAADRPLWRRSLLMPA